MTSTGGGSDISAALSDFVRMSLTNAQDMLQQERMVDSGERNLGEIIKCQKSDTTEASMLRGKSKSVSRAGKARCYKCAQCHHVALISQGLEGACFTGIAETLWTLLVA